MPIWNHAEAWEELSNGARLFRGFPTKAGSDVVTIQSPTERTPVNMPLAVQADIDDWFEARFGVRFRQQSIFSTGSQVVAHGYTRGIGEVRVLRPMADFSFCWSPVCEDLYGSYESSPLNESIPLLMERLEFRCEDLHSALLSNNEIMLVCRNVQATSLVADNSERIQND